MGRRSMMPSFSFTEASVNSITTKEVEVKGFLAALSFSFSFNLFNSKISRF